MLALSWAVNPGEGRMFLEALVILMGASKWPALAVAVGLGVLAYKGFQDAHEKGESSVMAVVCVLGAGGALGWFIGGLGA